MKPIMSSKSNEFNNPNFIYICPGMNSYEMAINAVGKIIEDYDSDKQFPVLGFGARFPDGQVSHKFNVNGHPSNPDCDGMSGVLSAYKSCIRKIELYGPTNFAPTIQHVTKVAQSFLDGSQYFILLIITDGQITDMEETKIAIVDAALLPISIVIVGIGEADFDKMNELDGDEIRVTDKFGRVATRDIVQFVAMRNILGIEGPNYQAAGAYLANEVLDEIPDQFLGFMKSRNIVPTLPHATSTNQSRKNSQVNPRPDPELVNYI